VSLKKQVCRAACDVERTRLTVLHSILCVSIVRQTWSGLYSYQDRMTGLGTRSIGKSLRLFDPRGVAVDSYEMVEFCRIAVSCIWHIGVRDPTKATFCLSCARHPPYPFQMPLGWSMNRFESPHIRIGNANVGVFQNR
jgi:hypothetical protein